MRKLFGSTRNFLSAMAAMVLSAPAMLPEIPYDKIHLPLSRARNHPRQILARLKFEKIFPHGHSRKLIHKINRARKAA